MLTDRLHLLPTAVRPAWGGLHRLKLRLRARWLAWRGVSVLRVVPAPARAALAQHAGGEAGRIRGLLELNLMFERARSKPASPVKHDQPGLTG